jgi:hypothetical protein
MAPLTAVKARQRITTGYSGRLELHIGFTRALDNLGDVSDP